MKTPYNWIGNKYKYMENINRLVEGRDYAKVYDVFMGSGNVLFNLDCSSNEWVGNDIIPLLPRLYESITELSIEFSLEDLQDVIDNWGNFSSKEGYYKFRDYWNSKYKKQVYNYYFIYETVLLLKMCSNSMVRFNSKGEFNQGFRGLGDKSEFFTESMKVNIIKQLNDLRIKLKSGKFIFNVGDFKNVLPKLSSRDLVILDPPYILGSVGYGGGFNENSDRVLLGFLKNTDSDYIYFNYLERDGVVNEGLVEFVNEYNPYCVEELSFSTSTGQGIKNSLKIVEVMISNIRG